MSRIGKLPIKVPNDIKVNIEGEVIKITKGSVSKEYTFGDKVSVSFYHIFDLRYLTQKEMLIIFMVYIEIILQI